jgi:hypothetical protein
MKQLIFVQIKDLWTNPSAMLVPADQFFKLHEIKKSEKVDNHGKHSYF